MPDPGLVKDVGLIAGFDLRESLRTRRALVLIVLYVLAATLTAYTYVRVVHESEVALGRVLSEGNAKDRLMAGAAVGLARSQGYREALRFFAGGDASMVDYLASIPPMVLVFLWCSLTFLPWLVALTSYDQIAADVHLRTVRYVVLRTPRSAFVLGKLLAQALLFAGVAGLTTVPVFLLGWRYLDSFDATATALALVHAWPVMILYAAAFLGATSLASQLARSPAAARAAAVGLLFALWIVGLLRGWAGQGGWHEAAALLAYLSPWSYKAGFFHPAWTTRAASAAACVGLGAGYVALGYARFRGRDL